MLSGQAPAPVMMTSLCAAIGAIPCSSPSAPRRSAQTHRRSHRLPHRLAAADVGRRACGLCSHREEHAATAVCQFDGCEAVGGASGGRIRAGGRRNHLRP